MSQLTIRSDTDTAHAQAVIPIYFFHTLDRPLCSLPSCECKAHQQSITSLFQQIQAGALILREAATFAPEITIEERSEQQ